MIQPEDAQPIAIVDVHYSGDSARAACIVAPEWGACDAAETRVSEISGVRPYVPGRFFERELPCIVDVLAKVTSRFGTIVIDGYVHLDEHGKPGLGGHLYVHYGGSHPVVGVAKSAFGQHPSARQVFRGGSKRPLFVTAEGVEAGEAARLVSAMHGAHRIPTLLGMADRIARGLRG